MDLWEERLERLLQPGSGAAPRWALLVPPHDHEGAAESHMLSSAALLPVVLELGDPERSLGSGLPLLLPEKEEHSQKSTLRHTH